MLHSSLDLEPCHGCMTHVNRMCSLLLKLGDHPSLHIFWPSTFKLAPKNNLHKIKKTTMCAQVDNIMVPTRHCFFADRGMRFKHIWFHRPHQQNSDAAVCDHWQPSVATLLIGACNSNTFGFINLISKIATQLHMITVLQQHVLWFVFCIPWSSDLISSHIL